MDKDIENAVKSCKGCALAAKAPPIKFNSWPKTNLPWSRIHTDFAGPLEGYYYLIVLDSFSKCHKVYRCKNPTTEITIKFLYELFTRFGVVDTLVSDNGSQFTSGEFRDSCETYKIEHITIPPYHPRSNGQAERFVNTLKRALKKKARATPTERALQQFLQVYRITSNNKTPASQSPAEVMFARRVWSVHDKLLLKQTKPGRTCTVHPKQYNPRDKVFSESSKTTNLFGEIETIEIRIGNMIYIIKGPQFTHKRHLNQLRERLTDVAGSGPSEGTVIDVIYDTFNIRTPLVAPEMHCSKRKRKATDLIVVNTKCIRY